MGSIALEVIVLLVLIMINGLLAMAEIAVVSARKARLQEMANQGDEKARTALELANEPTDFLSTVQIGITLVGILAGVFGGATLADQLAIALGSVPVLAAYSEALAVLLVVLMITYFSLVLGELAPKRLALGNAERYASNLARPMRTLSRFTMPLVRMLSWSTDGVLRLFGVRQSIDAPVTEEEIKVMIDEGTRAGVFHEAEQDMVEAVFRLGDRRVETIMTPRPEIVWLDLDETYEQIRQKIIDGRHTRIPVARGDLDHVIGIVHAKDLLMRALCDDPFDLEAILIQPIIVPESLPALRVLELFRHAPIRMAIAIDEFGGVQGVVTMFDIIESIVGTLPDQDELEEAEIVQREDGSWLVDGRLPIDEFKAKFRLRRLPDDDRGHYQTVGGFVMTRLGRIPSVSDSFEWSGMRFEVVDMDDLRVDKVLVVPPDAHNKKSRRDRRGNQ